MSPVARQLDEVEVRIERLRREYDLFFAGIRRGAPIVLRDDLERLILKLTREPGVSTAVRFRLHSLAHRFRALDGQVRQRIEAADRRGGLKAAEGVTPAGEVSVLLDAAAVANPGAVRAHLLRMHRVLAGTAHGAAAERFPFERLEERLLAETRKQLMQPGVKGVRYRVVSGEEGPRLRAELVAATPS